jgi:hypothetical protein
MGLRKWLIVLMFNPGAEHGISVKHSALTLQNCEECCRISALSKCRSFINLSNTFANSFECFFQKQLLFALAPVTIAATKHIVKE